MRWSPGSAPPRADAALRVLDVAGGTGDIAFRIARPLAARRRHRRRHQRRDAGGRAGARAARRQSPSRLAFVEANAEELPFADGRFDAVTIAFGIRNVPRIDRALAEAFRVLKPGGRFLCLEFSAVDVAGLDRLYELFSFKVIPPLGRLVTGDAEPYRYLVELIRRFPNQARFAAMIEDAGFGSVELPQPLGRASPRSIPAGSSEGDDDGHDRRALPHGRRRLRARPRGRLLAGRCSTRCLPGRGWRSALARLLERREASAETAASG